MVSRVLALLILPTAALLTVAVVRWLSIRAQPGAEHRYNTEADVFLLLLPTVVTYALALPFVWRTAQRASVRAVAGFSALTFVLTIAGLFLTMGPLYQVIRRFNPTLADRAYFLLALFLPVVVAITLSLLVLRRTTSPEAATPR